MKQVTIFLKTPLFAVKGEVDSVPPNAIIIEGEVVGDSKGGIHIQTTAYFSLESISPSKQERKKLKGGVKQLIIPFGKIDHIRIND